MATLKEADTDYKFDSHFLPFLQNVPFFAELSRHMKKVPTEAIPTAGVTFDVLTDDIVLYYNPKFMKSIEESENGDAKIHGLLTHEFYHIVFQHLSSRRKTPHKMWNIATDAAINSIIMYNENGTPNNTMALPDGGIIPGRECIHPTGRELTKEEKTAAPLAYEIKKWPILKASEIYMQLLQKFAQEQEDKCPVHGDGKKKSEQKQDGNKKKGKGKGKKGDKGESSGGAGEPSEGNGSDGGSEPGCTCGKGDGIGDMDSFDDHNIWDDVGETSREYIEARINDAVSKAVKHADQQSNGWGNIPASMRADIRASVTHEINWRTELRNWVGTTCRGERTNSLKRINKRYPYIFAGTRRNYRPKLLVAIDQSGSVGDDALALFFGEINGLHRLIDVDVVFFDTEALAKDVFTWRKGAATPARLRRERCGGTDFDAPTTLANDPKNRGRWDGYIILTDGCAPKPANSRMRRLWVICPGQKLIFETSDRSINLTKEHPHKGAWR